jgi:hypothetical protein
LALQEGGPKVRRELEHPFGDQGEQEGESSDATHPRLTLLARLRVLRHLGEREGGLGLLFSFAKISSSSMKMSHLNLNLFSSLQVSNPMYNATGFMS